MRWTELSPSPSCRQISRTFVIEECVLNTTVCGFEDVTRLLNLLDYYLLGSSRIHIFCSVFELITCNFVP